jgi:S-adenosylmethionine synthetase
MPVVTFATAESVTEGHPDKLCDQISDAVLDELLRQDPSSRVAVETLATAGVVVVAGEVTTRGFVDVQQVVRGVLRDVGYTDASFGADSDDVGVLVSLHRQSADISRGLKEGKGLGAGDQGLMFGYACQETPELMPLPITLAHRLAEGLAKARKSRRLPYLRPDGKTQVVVEYHDGMPVRVAHVVVAAQHDPSVSNLKLRTELLTHVVKPALGKLLDARTKVSINATGRFVQGGPEADTGLTGRKIIVDTYGGYARHGGGCFSGKDPSKVDRSAAYAARYIAKNLVAAGFARQCEVRLGYVIGEADPICLDIDTFGTGVVDQEVLRRVVRQHFPLRPAAIIKHLKLRRPVYRVTAAYGHFGRTGAGFTWERLDKVTALKRVLKRIG